MSGFDPPTMFRILAEREVEYVLIGAMAAALQGAGLTATADVDIAPAPDEPNRTRLAAALREMDARLRIGGDETPVAVALDARTFAGMSVMTFVTTYGPFDVLFDPAGAPPYAELHERGTTVSLSGVAVRVAAVEDVIAMKRAAGRRKDAAHVVVLLEYLRARDRKG